MFCREDGEEVGAQQQEEWFKHVGRVPIRFVGCQQYNRNATFQGSVHIETWKDTDHRPSSLKI